VYTTAATGRSVTVRNSASAARISCSLSPVSMAMMPSGASMNVWFERPFPTRHHTPGRTVYSCLASTSL